MKRSYIVLKGEGSAGARHYRKAASVEAEDAEAAIASCVQGSEGGVYAAVAERNWVEHEVHVQQHLVARVGARAVEIDAPPSSTPD